jgi:hypothetical protein
MEPFQLEFKEKQLIEFEKNKMISEFEKINGKSKNLKHIKKYDFRAFLKDYELNHINHLTLEQRSLIVKKFYKHFKMPFFNADFKNLEKNTQFILQETIPLILEIDEIPKCEITRTIIETLDYVIEKNLPSKGKSEKVLIKQVSFRNIFENFLPELIASPENALFIK